MNKTLNSVVRQVGESHNSMEEAEATLRSLQMFDFVHFAYVEPDTRRVVYYASCIQPETTDPARNQTLVMALL